MLMNTQDHYALIARLLHWLIFALVMGMLAGGSALSLLPSGGLKAFAVAGHKTVGVITLVLMLVRLLWRSTNPSPRFLGANPLLNYVAHVLHIVLYLLVILQPLTGVLMSQAYGYPVSFFGVFEVPPIVWHSPVLGSFFREVHGVTALFLSVTIAIHAVAALKHHFIDRDHTLRRMIKGQ